MYEDAEFSEEILRAIEIMASFNPSSRMKAKLLDEYAFDQLQSLVYISKDEKDMMDMDDKKKFADLLIKTSAAMSKFIQNSESGYGVKIKERVKKEKFELKASVADVIETVEPKETE